MPRHNHSRRENQRRRTRKDLLDAAARLMKAGRTPDMGEVAAEAMVSRATAYRHFQSVEALLVEAPLDGEVPDAAEIFGAEPSTDPQVRIDRAEAALHEMVYRNERALRAMVAASLEHRTSPDGSSTGPIRQNRRSGLIEAALEPARAEFTDGAYRRLCAALALIFGPESMIVFSDVLGLDSASARKVKGWAVKALVRVALEESAKGSKGRASDSPAGRGHRVKGRRPM